MTSVLMVFSQFVLCLICSLSLSGKINSMSVSGDGLLLSTASDDKALKIFDVVNFGE